MSIAVEHGITEDAIHKALSKVQDPEIHRSITELDMVKEVHVAADGAVKVAIFLTVAGCPMKDRLTNDIKQEVGTIEPGKVADLVVVRGDPSRSISDVRQVEHVFQRGRLVASGGQLLDDGRPLPWPLGDIAERRSLWDRLE